jgi:hypothetical protein
MARHGSALIPAILTLRHGQTPHECGESGQTISRKDHIAVKLSRDLLRKG